MTRKAYIALVVERAAAAGKRARARFQRGADAFRLLGEESGADPLAVKGTSMALAGNTFEMAGATEADNEIGRVEHWVQTMQATRH